MEEQRVDWIALQKFSTEVFIKAGMPPEDAALEAEVLVWANLCGVESHGVLRIHWYIELIDKGYINLQPNIQIVKETPAVLVIDGDRAFGPVVTVFAMRKAIEKARQTGIGWALLRNITHQGALGYYSRIAAVQDAVGLTVVSSPPNMAPFGAKVAGVHNSPIAIAAPANRHAPLILDMATSIAAGGKLRFARDKGTSIPPGWALDKDGKSATDPNLAAVLLPIAGPKGSGLAVMFECMTGIMAGNPLQEPLLTGRKKEREHTQNGIVAAIDIGTFTDVGEYKETVDRYIDGLKSLPKAEDCHEILVPGELEQRRYEERKKTGIPLPSGTIQNLKKTADRFNLAFPF